MWLAGATISGVVLAGCGSGAQIVNSADAVSGPDATVCHDKALDLMKKAAAAGTFPDSLPKTSDRSIGIPECKGLTVNSQTAL